MNQLAPIVASHAPALITASGERASYRFFEFFTAQIRNPNTPRAYASAAEFLAWSEVNGTPMIAILQVRQFARCIRKPAIGKADLLSSLFPACLRGPQGSAHGWHC